MKRDVTVNSITCKSYQNVMIIVMPMIPLAKVAHLMNVSQNSRRRLRGVPKLTALLWAE